MLPVGDRYIPQAAAMSETKAVKETTAESKNEFTKLFQALKQFITKLINSAINNYFPDAKSGKLEKKDFDIMGGGIGFASAYIKKNLIPQLREQGVPAEVLDKLGSHADNAMSYCMYIPKGMSKNEYECNRFKQVMDEAITIIEKSDAHLSAETIQNLKRLADNPHEAVMEIFEGDAKKQCQEMYNKFLIFYAGGATPQTMNVLGPEKVNDIIVSGAQKEIDNLRSKAANMMTLGHMDEAKIFTQEANRLQTETLGTH